MNTFWGYEDFVDIFWGKSRYRIGVFFGLLKFQIFFGVLEIPDIFWG